MHNKSRAQILSIIPREDLENLASLITDAVEHMDLGPATKPIYKKIVSRLESHGLLLPSQRKNCAGAAVK